MFHGDHKDPEGGASFGMIVYQCLNALSGQLMGLTQLKSTPQMENLLTVLIALGLSSVCTQKWLKKKTIKWPRAGKTILTESSFS
jgi:hypothetical protein